MGSLLLLVAILSCGGRSGLVRDDAGSVRDADPEPDVAPADASADASSASPCVPGWEVVSPEAGFVLGVSSVWAASQTDAWAVGNCSIAHWNGDRWRTVREGLEPHLAACVRRGGHWSVVWGTSASDVWVGGRGSFLHWDGTGWTAFERPVPGDVRGLHGTSPTDVWAVGDETSHWDGVRWARVADEGKDVSLAGVFTAGPEDTWGIGRRGVYRWSGAAWDLIAEKAETGTAISGVSANDAWIVGLAGTLMHWDGDRWASVDRRTTRDLFGVWMASEADGWAVGRGGQTLHWDGDRWTVVDGPSDALLRAVHGSGPDDVWAVGGGIHHWDGRRWQTLLEVPEAAGDLRSVWGATARDVWVVGSGARILHWDGAVWTTIATHDSTWATLNSVWGASATDAWAVGDRGEIQHWDGAAWSPTTSGTRASLKAVWGPSADDVWAVGGDGTMLRWDGGSWRGVETDSDLATVWGSSADDVWVAGSRGTVLRWNGARWSDFSIDGASLSDVWGRGPRDAWAVGSVVAHWDGLAWSELPLAELPIDRLELLAPYFESVWGGSDGDSLWLAGGDGFMATWNLVLQRRGGQWTNLTMPAFVPARLHSGWSASNGETWIVGQADTILHYCPDGD